MSIHSHQHLCLCAISAANHHEGSFSLGGYLTLSLLFHLAVCSALFVMKENSEQTSSKAAVVEIDLTCVEMAGRQTAPPSPVPSSKAKTASNTPSHLRNHLIRTVRPFPEQTVPASSDSPVPEPEIQKDCEIKTVKVDGDESFPGAGSASHPPAAKASTLAGVTGNGAPATGEGGEGKEALADYSRAVRALIERNKEYPFAARKMGAHGSVVVSFSLDRHGELRGVSLAKSSGNSLLDNAGILAVRNVGKFPPPPHQIISGEVLSFRIPITFALTTG